MNKQGKVWGETMCLFSQNNVEIHRIEARIGMQCSKHCHKNKFNMFYVESGSLSIEVWKNDYELVDVTELHAGESMIVNPGEYHRFVSQNCRAVAYEIYWSELDPNDIDREDCGGEV